MALGLVTLLCGLLAGCALESSGDKRQQLESLAPTETLPGSYILLDSSGTQVSKAEPESLDDAVQKEPAAQTPLGDPYPLGNVDDNYSFGTFLPDGRILGSVSTAGTGRQFVVGGTDNRVIVTKIERPADYDPRCSPDGPVVIHNERLFWVEYCHETLTTSIDWKILSSQEDFSDTRIFLESTPDLGISRNTAGGFARLGLQVANRGVLVTGTDWSGVLEEGGQWRPHVSSADKSVGFYGVGKGGEVLVATVKDQEIAIGQVAKGESGADMPVSVRVPKPFHLLKFLATDSLALLIVQEDNSSQRVALVVNLETKKLEHVWELSPDDAFAVSGHDLFVRHVPENVTTEAGQVNPYLLRFTKGGARLVNLGWSPIALPPGLGSDTWIAVDGGRMALESSWATHAETLADRIRWDVFAT